MNPRDKAKSKQRLVEVVEVFAVVPRGESCFLWCRFGGYFVVRWNFEAQVCCFGAAFGYRRPPRHARTLVF